MFLKKNDTYLIVGLGNYGTKYNNTRHNIGFDVIDLLSNELNISVSKKKSKSLYGIGTYNNKKIILLKPLTFMNLSGSSVISISKYYNIDIEEKLLVICDDINLDVGRMKIKKSGSYGGHNGLLDIINMTRTSNFSRIRIGVGNNKNIDLSDYVLGHFDKDEISLIDKQRRKAARCVLDFIDKGIDYSMNKYNN